MSAIDRREALKRTAALLGGVISIPTMSAVLSGCQPSGSGSDWSPAALSDHQNDLVIAISEHIIPATDTPGAKAAQVNRFIDGMLAESFLEKDRTQFLDGLDAVDARSQEMHGAPFLDTSAEQQVALLEALDEEAHDPQTSQNIESPPYYRDDDLPADAPPPEEAPFFRMMKELTLIGYYTSEIGATQELRFDPVMGRYDPCVPLEEIGRAWA